MGFPHVRVGHRQIEYPTPYRKVRGFLFGQFLIISVSSLSSDVFSKNVSFPNFAHPLLLWDSFGKMREAMKKYKAIYDSLLQGLS